MQNKKKAEGYGSSTKSVHRTLFVYMPVNNAIKNLAAYPEYVIVR